MNVQEVPVQHKTGDANGFSLETVVEELNNVRREMCFVKSINGTVVFHQSCIMPFRLSSWLHLAKQQSPTHLGQEWLCMPSNVLA